MSAKPRFVIRKTYRHGFVVLFGRLVWLPTMRRPREALCFVRHLFPSFWSRSAHCCDHGGQAFAAWPEFAFNRWDLISRQLQDYGDGPDAWHQISFFNFVTWKIQLWRKGQVSERLDA